MAQLQRGLVTKIQAEDVLEGLAQVSREINGLATRYAEAEGILATTKVGHSQSKDALAEAEGIATFTAYGAGRVDSKNESQRTAQITAALNDDNFLQEQRQIVRHSEHMLADAEVTAITAREVYTAAQYRLQALRAQADLLVALLAQPE